MTFGGLALLGAAAGAGAPAVAAAVALLGAVAEARGGRIVPQVARQVPESWRRVLPVPLAAGLYGVLLGLGFTTFILSFAVWALAGISVALGDPAARRRDRARVRRRPGAAGGRAGAVRRRRAARGDGRAAHASCARCARSTRSRSSVCAAALWVAPAQAAVKIVAGAASRTPASTGPRSPCTARAAPGNCARPGSVQPLPGNHPAVGGGHIAWMDGANVVIAGIATIPAPGADAVAVSSALGRRGAPATRCSPSR